MARFGLKRSPDGNKGAEMRGTPLNLHGDLVVRMLILTEAKKNNNPKTPTHKTEKGACVHKDLLLYYYYVVGLTPHHIS